MDRVFYAAVVLTACLQAQTQLSPSDRDFITNHFGAAKDAEALHQFPNAIKEYQLILSRYPSALPEMYQNLGLLYYLDRDYENAIRVFERGIHLKPAMAGAQLFLGSAYLTKGQPQRALPHLLSGYQAQPNGEGAVFVGLCLNALRRYSEANQYYRAALQGSDETAYCLYLLGNSYLKLSEQVEYSLSERYPDSKFEHLITAKVVDAQEWYQIAAKEYLESVKRDPMNASLLLPLARWLAVLGQDQASNMAFDRYRQLMPFDRDAKIDRANLPREEMANIGIMIDYIAELSALPKVDPHSLPPVPLLPLEVNEKLAAKLKSPAGAKWRAAANAIVSFRWEAASEQLSSIQDNSNDWLRDYMLASVGLWRGNAVEAEKAAVRLHKVATSVPALECLEWDIFRQASFTYFQRLLDEYPQSAWAHFLKGRTLGAQGKMKAADEYLAAIAADPKLPEVHIALADLYLSNSRVPEALAECQKELELNPYSNTAKARLGRIYVESRETEKALPYLRQALAEDPDDAGVRADLGRALELQGETVKAIAEYERALKLDPSLNRLRYVLARLYRKVGKPALAQREYELFHAKEATARQEYLDRVRKLRELDNSDREAAAGQR